MRFVFLSVALASALALVGCGKSGPNSAGSRNGAAENLLHVHFLGLRQVGADTNGLKFKEVLADPATRALLDDALMKLARAPKELFALRINTAHVDRSSIFRPLLDDLLQSESVISVWNGNQQKPEWGLAVRLAEDRNRVWQTNLLELMRDWMVGTPTPVRMGNWTGWEVRKHEAPNLFRVLRAGEWLVAGLGQDRLPAMEQTLKNVATQGIPTTRLPGVWLSLRANLPKLAQVAAYPLSDRWPNVELAVSGRGENLRTVGHLTFNQPVVATIPPWHVPTNTIRDPLIGFTALRGLTPLTSQVPWFERLGITPTPDQFYIWSLAQIPFQTYLIAPVANPKATLESVAARMPNVVSTHLKVPGTGQVRWNTNRTEILWVGVPFVSPYLRAVSEPDGQYVLAGLFPTPPTGRPVPADLLAQFAPRKEVVAYSWEITQARIAHWRTLMGVDAVISAGKTSPTNSIPQRWLQAASTRLENTVTEVTSANPRQLEFVRSSQIGLTAFELIKMVDWLDQPGFPFGGYRFPAPAGASNAPALTPKPAR